MRAEVERLYGSIDRAKATSSSAMLAFEKINNKVGMAAAALGAGDLKFQFGAVAEACSLYEKAVRLYCEEHAYVMQALALISLANVYDTLGDRTAAGRTAFR
jgi:tetratricopeptide (TPR) repeat protein